MLSHPAPSLGKLTLSVILQMEFITLIPSVHTALMQILHIPMHTMCVLQFFQDDKTRFIKENVSHLLGVEL